MRVQASQLYASYAVVLIVSQSSYVYGGIVPPLKHCDKQKKFFKTVLWRKTLFRELLRARNLVAVRL